MKRPTNETATRSGRRHAVVACACVLLPASIRTLAFAAEDHVSRDALADNELKRAAQRAELCSGSKPAGVGLRGEYFARESWAGSALLIRTDAVVDFDASLEWPERPTERKAPSQQMPRSVRWTGWLRPPLSGVYRFHADAANSRVIVAGQPMAGAAVPADASVELAAGRFYPVTFEVSRIEPGTRRMRLEWTAPHGARFVVPRPLLYLPTETVATPRS